MKEKRSRISKTHSPKKIPIRTKKKLPQATRIIKKKTIKRLSEDTDNG